jgi:hypothetical protein
MPDIGIINDCIVFYIRFNEYLIAVRGMFNVFLHKYSYILHT